MKRGTALCIVAVLGTGFFGALTHPAAAQRVTVKVSVDGIERTALVDPGKSATTTPSPLVLVFHWAGGSAAEMANVTRISRTWPEATIVYPQGLPRTDPGGGSAYRGWQWLPGELEDRDLRFVATLLKDLSATFKVDERRVFVTGASNGAGFAYLLLAVRPGQFAAFAPVAIGASPSLQWARVPRPTLMTHGLKDDQVPVSLAEWARNHLQRLNGCGAQATDWTRGAVSYQPCSSGQSVIWSLHTGGHVWPPEATNNIVRFFKEQTLPTVPTVPDLTTDLDLLRTVVGTGKAGFAGDGGSAAAAQLFFPEGVALDSAGSLFIADTGNFRVRKVGPDGIITAVAGTGQFGFTKTNRADRATLLWPAGLVLDQKGNLFVADTYNRQVRQVTPDGIIRTVAGRERPDIGPIRFSGDGGPGSQAELSFPAGLAVNSTGDLFIADTENHRVRKVNPDGIITTIAGTGTAGFSGVSATATDAQLNEPWGLALDRAGNLFIADSSNHRVRKIMLNGRIITVAGTGTAGFAGDEGTAIAAQLNRPLGLAVDSQDNLFIVDSLNYRVRKVSPNGVITTVFGGDTASNSPGSPGPYYPSSVAVDREGNLLIADAFHHRIFEVTGVAAPGLIAGQPFPAP